MQRPQVAICFIVGLALLIAGGLVLWNVPGAAPGACPLPPPQTVAVLDPGILAAMDSAPFAYSPGWQVSAAGADPPEPADPFTTPAGVVAFSYTGRDLYLLLHPADYWAYLYVTVDGQPANRLPALGRNSAGAPAGYKPLLAPERAGEMAPLPVLVHQGSAGARHEVRVETWRGWGRTPLRGVAVDPPWMADAACTGRAVWPAVLLVLLGASSLGLGAWLHFQEVRGFPGGLGTSRRSGDFLEAGRPAAWILAEMGLVLAATGVALQAWWLCLPGLGLLALAGLVRPAHWLGALLFGLPFAFGLKLPLLPARAFDLIDVGVWGGLILMLAHLGLLAVLRTPLRAPRDERPARNWPLLALAAVATWALVAATAAGYPGLALREWRVVFLNALVFGGLLAVALRSAPDPARERWLLVTAWLAGGAAVALFGLWGYLAGNDLVSQAEGVRRIQAFYGSGNNLALYLDRTLAVALALLLFMPASVSGPVPGRDWRAGLRSVVQGRLLWVMLAAPMALAWLLTFSKGSLFLAAPAMALVLLLAGGWLLRREGRSPRPLWLLLGLAGLALLALIPFLGTERFQRLLDFNQGTGFLRLQLWQSAWRMALDHPWLGVGPDNFLYVYRSGYLLPAAWQEPDLNHPHNLLLDWWTRLGLPGLLLGLSWLGAGVGTVLAWLRRGPERALALGVLAACAAALAHGLIDVSYALPDLMIVWVLLFGIAVRRSDSQRPVR